ncbi:suppressor APC domain-containing protein 2-like [Mizuhopecten yessoensis]|uniref:Suppressor APC domain-containing protein 2 n=1 Tax=Mizuhopecten yessoensis TaxID=6573 RepID=A0A210Q1P5_MIZYE|nr:suppressor APC domain-containing protein 2-like [Mizuhopecten yessoensis]OWF42656.1 Suppressor APC domain-containing protein 2 [Mizuhopecten yessoensis]
MTSVTAWNSIEGLPKQFVKSLRVLFDILDEQRCGYVRFVDIESRWHEEGVKGLPSGVIEALRKVTPHNGYLSFDRFVAGLKLAMLTSRNPRTHDHQQKHESHTHNKHVKVDPSRQGVLNDGQHINEKENRTEHGTRRTSQPRSDAPQPPKRSSHRALHQNRYHTINTAAVKPNNVLNALHDRSNVRKEILDHPEKYHSREKLSSYSSHHDVPISPISKSSVDSLKDNHNTNGSNPPQVPPRDKNNKRIITELKNWQRRIKEPGQPSVAKKEHFHQANSDSHLLAQSSHSSAGGVYVNIEQVARVSHSNESDPKVQNASSLPQKSGATVRRQNSARRHTLSSGVDYSMIKRLRQLEKEKEVLMQGLGIVEQAREWYQKQVQSIDEKQKYVGKATYNDNNLESHQERMNFQQARVSEVNQQLKTLIESSEKGFPLHMNLAVRSTNSTMNPEETVRMLKGQNRQLTKEVGQKGDMISKLEQEKATLVRDLFEARSQNKPTNYDDTTFM